MVEAEASEIDNEAESGADGEDGVDTLVFTASAAALPWVFGALACLLVFVALLILSTNGWADVPEPPLASAKWALIPVLPGLLCAWRALGLLRRPYLRLDAERVWIDPPRGDPRDIPWLQIERMESDARNVALVVADGRTESIDLRPIAAPRRGLAESALRGRVREFEV